MSSFLGLKRGMHGGSILAEGKRGAPWKVPNKERTLR